MRKEGSLGNICRIAVRLKGVLTAKQLHDKLSLIEGFGVISQIGIRRTVPFSIPYWKYCDDGKQLTVAEHSVPKIAGQVKIENLTPIVSLNIKHNAVIRFDLFRYIDRKTDILMSWHHGVMDIRGGLALFSQLCDDYAEEIDFGTESTTEKRSIVQKIKQLPAALLYARKSLIHIDQVCKAPITSFAPTNDSRSPKDNYTLIRFDRQQTQQIEQCCEQLASGFKKSIFSLAAVTMAIDTAVQSGIPDRDRTYVVPCPQNLRRKGGQTDILSNQVSFLFYRIDSKDLVDLQSTISTLSEQLMHQVRQQFPQSFRKAMDVFRILPVNLYSSILYGPSKGKLASFFFSDIGPLPKLNSINGLPVLDLVTPAPAPTTPAFAVASWSFNEMFNICFSYSKNTFTEKESSLIKEKLISVLLREQN